MIKKFLIGLLLVAVLTGSLFRLEERFQLFRLKGIEVQPQAIISNKKVWDQIPKRDKRLWPLLLFHRRELTKNIMEQVPVSARLELAGWGYFRLKVTPLTPWFMVFWNGSEWYLSLDGRVWSVHHEMNSVILHQEPREGPILVWNETMYDLVSGSSQRMTKSSVLVSRAPVEKLKMWKESLQSLGFYDDINSIMILQNGGTLLLELMMRKDSNTVKILVPASPEEWEYTFPAIREIIMQTGSKSGEIYIDGTYSGKILVRTEN
ncbi:MAG TPA: hypothetical protein DCE03_00175 [Synergistaceae bacterium]|nr:MAG: Uncharacterized protein XE12_0323 [Synergistales bacterium 54_9]HAA46901.1 hypothetical protein [Synergistaceae bacterium]HAG22783.1 hypothetical protein [Synergistaceae bacterium]